MSFVKRCLLTVLICCMCVSSSAYALSLGGEDKKVADTIMNRIIRSNSRIDLVMAPESDRMHPDLVERYVDEKCGKYYRVTTCLYTREWHDDRWFEGFVIHTRDAKNMYNYNTMLVKKAKKIVKKYTRKRMSKKNKARALAKGVAKMLSYRDYDDNDVEASMARNLKKNKGVCCTYAQLYQACCDIAKIECVHVIGYADGGLHSWNRVKIGKKWKFVDTTWYDATKRSKYIMSSKLWGSHKMVRSIIVFE